MRRQDAKAYCPRDATFGCALDSIWSKHRACVVDEDCVFVQVSNCVGYGSCAPLSVADAGKDAFLAEANVEVGHYCLDAGCGESGSCALDAGGIRPFCYQGKCGWR